MKRLKPKQLGPFCSYCPPRTAHATHVQTGWHGLFCCVEHKPELAAHESKPEHLTEADYQTWMKL